MQFKINSSYIPSFVYNGVPKVLKHYINVYDNDRKLFKMDNYLKNTLGINYKAKDILLFALTNSFKADVGKYCIINIGNIDEFKDTKYSLISLVKLIENGNLDIKGSQVLHKAFDYLRTNLETFWDMYCYGSL